MYYGTTNLAIIFVHVVCVFMSEMCMRACLRRFMCVCVFVCVCVHTGVYACV